MPHWLEQAEESSQPQKESHSRADRISQRFNSIQENFAANGKAYIAFMEDLHGLISRVNNLPASKRVPFGKMEGREKESKLNNYLNIFSSSQRMKRKKLFSFIPFFESGHFKHIRAIYMNISHKAGMIEVEVKEYILQRKRIESDKKSSKVKAEEPDKFHVIYTFPIDDLDHETALEIIDWLAFSKEIAECNFYNTVPEDVKHYH
ncbi:MAG: hypothetical protein HGA37_13150 [Lentimicrobium sp.]|nr:hypothetical protein [Lentimicrobium sp.]